MAVPANFVDLQAAFYNALSQALGFSPSDPFQVIQPSPPLTPGADADQLLWNYFNAIPPLSLSQNTVLSGGNQFLANYQGVMSALQAGPNNFESSIGPACYAAYLAAVKMGQVQEGDPRAFRNWALVNSSCSSVALQGASALAAALLDPFFAAQMNVMPYRPAGTENVNFVPGFATMMSQLQAAPSRSIPLIGTNQWNENVSTTWSSGSDASFFGLWGDSSSTSDVSQKFASSGVTLQASFGNVLQLPATPGDWYSSAAFGAAFANPGRDPWVSGNPINWETTFGPNGNMQRFMSTLVVVQSMEVTVTSAASFSESEQTAIVQNTHNGLWPFYTSGSSGGTTNVGFGGNGNMTVRIASDPGVAVVIGCLVVPANEYLGDTAEAASILMAARAA